MQKNSDFECGVEFAPIIRSFLGLDRIEEFVWVLRSGDVACFGFDDPEKPHILEWAYVDADADEFDEKCKKTFVEIDAMGSSSSLNVGGAKEVRCQIGAEHSTKVVEFVETLSSRSVKKRSIHHQAIVENDEQTDSVEDDEDVGFTIRFDIPTLSVSVIDNADAARHGREILLAQFDNLFASFSQSREGYHEMELRLMNLQVDNHIPASIHPVFVRIVLSWNRI